MHLLFSNKDVNEFILLFRKVVHPYKCMDDWKKLNEKKLPKKQEFDSNLRISIVKTRKQKQKY